MKATNLFKWQKGRQLSGYDKMLLAGAYWPIKFDMYLLRFREGSEIEKHKDEVKKGNHYRLNIVIKKSKSGGEFVCENPIYENSRIKYFRPDISYHSVTKIEQGTRYVLSIGWVKHT